MNKIQELHNELMDYGKFIKTINWEDKGYCTKRIISYQGDFFLDYMKNGQVIKIQKFKG